MFGTDTSKIRLIEYKCGTSAEGLLTMAATAVLLPFYICLSLILWSTSQPAVVILGAAWIYSIGMGVWMWKFRSRPKEYALYSGTMADMFYRRSRRLFFVYATVKYILLTVVLLATASLFADDAAKAVPSPGKRILLIFFLLTACGIKAAQDGVRYYNYYGGYAAVTEEQPGAMPLTYRLLAKIRLL